MKKRFWNLALSKAMEKQKQFQFSSKGYYVVDDKLASRKYQTMVSVITPVYNADKYLRKTIDSVINQSLG